MTPMAKAITDYNPASLEAEIRLVDEMINVKFN